MDNKILEELHKLKAVQERDIDLLLLEELNCSDQFLEWFLMNTIGPDNFELIGSWHSISESGFGESDLILKILKNEELIIFLIENKIDAVFQKDQVIRYKSRGQHFKDKRECFDFYTVLISPKEYIVKGFDYNITYEDIQKWFENLYDKRSKFKASVFNTAILKLRRGYFAINNENTQTFWKKYYLFVTENYSHLMLKTPKERIPKNSFFFYFKPKKIGLNNKDTIVHKAPYGNIDLQLAGKAEDIALIKEKFESILPEEVEIVKAGKSLCFRINTEPINVLQDFESQIDLIKDSINKANLLYEWAKNTNTIKIIRRNEKYII